jgi:hypothetical protein
VIRRIALFLLVGASLVLIANLEHGSLRVNVSPDPILYFVFNR